SASSPGLKSVSSVRRQEALRRRSDPARGGGAAELPELPRGGHHQPLEHQGDQVNNQYDTEQVFGWTVLDQEELTKVMVALADHLGLRIIKVTDKEWSEGHPDRIFFTIEKAE